MMKAIRGGALSYWILKFYKKYTTWHRGLMQKGIKFLQEHLEEPERFWLPIKIYLAQSYLTE